MKVGSVFSGIGGFELGLQMASPDFEIAWQVEQDQFCQKVLAKHWPDARRWDDVKTFPPEPVEDWAVDLICGGWPCQPVSNAGRQEGEDDERWLWPEFRRICEVLRPRWVLGENVTGLLSATDAMGRRGGLFGGVLRDLASLSAIVSSTTAYRLPVLARSTGVIGSGSWPTPDAVHRGAAAPDLVVNYSKVKRRKSGQVRGMDLETAVQMFPTPTSRDWKDTPGMALESVNPDGSRRDRTDLLPGRIYAGLRQDQDRPSGSLNPTWVEWLMGYPLGWTDLDHSETQ